MVDSSLIQTVLTVLREHAVLGDEPLTRHVRPLDLAEDALAIVRVQDVDEEVRIGGPLLHRVPEQRLHLRARIDVGRVVRQLVDVDHERELLDQLLVVRFERTIPGVGLVEKPRRLPDEAHERRHHECREEPEVDRAIDGGALSDPREDAARHDDGNARRQEPQPQDAAARSRPLRKQGCEARRRLDAAATCRRGTHGALIGNSCREIKAFLNTRG